jgi:protein involved in ribonucleotide reduction
MKKPTFTTEIFIKSAPERVIKFLADLSEHDKIHPLIVSVEEIDVHQEQFRRYRITDRVPMGPFTIKAVYEADIWQTDEGNLRSIARQSPGIVLHNTTSAVPQADGTLLREDVTVKAPFLLLNFTYRQAKESHQKMFERVKAVLEAE